MSTRFYPRFVKGNPQLRVFLPDYKLVMVKPKHPLPDNMITFKTDVRMTNWDIKNYLEKIYKVNVGSVNSVIRTGQLKRVKEGLAKWEDYRLAYVTLPIGETFKWPDLSPEDKFQEQKSDYDRTVNELSKNRTKDPNIQDIPSWFV